MGGLFARRAVRSRASPRGFTLLELLITLSVTTIGLVGLLSLHLSIARGNDGASRSADAQQIASSEIESLRGLSVPAMYLALTGTETPALPTTARVRTATGRNGMRFTVNTQVQPVAASPSLLKIRTWVTWTDDGGTFGANAGQLDHQLALELIRTLEDAL
jgi:prepilin-type N-terminal cleavage/methylation domain-containing protein